LYKHFTITLNFLTQQKIIATWLSQLKGQWVALVTNKMATVTVKIHEDQSSVRERKTKFNKIICQWL